MKTLIVCGRADVAKLVERTFFPSKEGKKNDTLVIAAGHALLGYHFDRFVFMPGWDEHLSTVPVGDEPTEKEKVYNQIMNRRTDKTNYTVVYL